MKKKIIIILVLVFGGSMIWLSARPKKTSDLVLQEIPVQKEEQKKQLGELVSAIMELGSQDRFSTLEKFFPYSEDQLAECKAETGTTPVESSLEVLKYAAKPLRFESKGFTAFNKAKNQFRIHGILNSSEKIAITVCKNKRGFSLIEIRKD